MIYKMKDRLTIEQKKKVGIIIACIFLAIAVIAIANYLIEEHNPSGTDYYMDENGNVYDEDGNFLFKQGDYLTPEAEPYSGEILVGREVHGESDITITASSNNSCYVKLETPSGVERLCFYVRAGETVTVGVPAEHLYVKFATGKTWYGEYNMFGENTSYSMDDEIVDFRRYTISYTLYPVNDGNFSQTPIDPDEF